MSKLAIFEYEHFDLFSEEFSKLEIDPTSYACYRSLDELLKNPLDFSLLKLMILDDTLEDSRGSDILMYMRAKGYEGEVIGTSNLNPESQSRYIADNKYIYKKHEFIQELRDGDLGNQIIELVKGLRERLF